jgi:DNA-binding winged helix-turn-helix (wHTH) protein/tetratricopeptide (TPR) repeat protein
MRHAPEVCFRAFRLDTANERLWRGTRKVILRPKTFAVLRYLVENAGRLVTKNELLDAVWPGTAVSDVVPIVCIRELRKALGDDADAPRFIETMSRRGYRFIAPLTAAPRSSLESRGWNLASERQSEGSPVQTPDPRRQALGVPLFGREPELARLHQLLDGALNGERQIVFVSGEPGIGKTALVEAFLRSLASRVQSPEERQNANPKSQIPNPHLWLAYGQCIEHHGAGEAYLPLLDVTGRMCQEPGGEHLIAVLRRYAPTWLMQFPALLSSADVEELQHRILGATRERMLREMAEATEVLTATRPLVLVLEDLHWCDSSTLDYLAFLARRRGPARLLLIGTYRPMVDTHNGQQLATLKQDLFLHRQCEDLVLPLLTQDHVATYLDARLPVEVRDGMPLDIWAAHLHRRTEGNPLFLVNVVDYLIARSNREGEGWSLQSMEQLLEVVPESLQQMIEKQLERLSAAEQQILEVASAVGVEFSAAAVAAGVESDVVEIEDRCRELDRHDGTVATRYSFIHSLYQQVISRRVTDARKARLHLRIGNRLEQGYGPAAREYGATLASHFTHGRDYRRAVQYLHAAAENAIWRCAFPEANAHFTQGVELLRHWPDTPERTQQELLLYLTVIGPLMASTGEASIEVERCYAQIIKLHQRLGATEIPFLVLSGLWMIRLVRGELAAAQEHAEQMMRQAEKEGEVAQLWAHLVVGTCEFYRGNFASAHAHFVQEAALYETQQHPQYLLDPKMLGLSLDALTLWALGYPDEAFKRSHEAIVWAQGMSHPYNGVVALVMAAWLHVNLREGRLAEERIEVLLPIAETHGFVQHVAVGRLLRGCAYVEQGQSDKGVRLMFEGIEAMQAVKVGISTSVWKGLFAVAFENLDRIEEALAMVAEAETAMHTNGERLYEAELRRIKGEILLAQEGKRQKAKGKKQTSENLNPKSSIPNPQSDAEACFLKAIDIARQQQAKSLELRAVMSLVRLRQQQATQCTTHDSQHDAHALLSEAHSMLSEVYGWFTEGFETVDLREAKALLEN